MSTQANIPAPPSGVIVPEREVTRQALWSGYSTLRLSSAFAGASSPTQIWQEMVADRQTAFMYYRELEEKDDGVANVLDKLKRSVLRRPYQVAAFDDSDAAQECADFIAAQFERVNFHEKLDSILDASGYGVSIHEVVFSIASGEVGIEDILDCPQELFTFGPTNLPQIGALRYLRNPGDLITGGELVPEQKFLVFTHRRRARNRRGRPLLRSVFWTSWFKRNALRFWLRFAEKGPGTAAVKYPQSATDDEQKKALAAAEAVIESVAIAIPENFNLIVELLTAARSQDPAVYEKLYDRMDHSIARRVLGQTLTSFGGSEQGKGTQALGEIHKEVEDETAVELARALEAAVNRQVIAPLVIWNFGPNAPMPALTFEKGEPADLASRINVDRALQQMGVPIPKNYALETYQIPEAGPQDEILQARAAVSALGGNNAGSGDPQQQDAGSQFSEEQIRKDQEDLRRLMVQLKTESFDVYAKRMKDLAAALTGGAQ